MYKPNFCAECGSKVERARWRPWTSRRFCSGCARRFRKSQFVLISIVGTTLLGLGFVAGRTQRPSPPPLTIERSEMASVKPPAVLSEEQEAEQSANDAPGKTSKPEPSYGPDGTATERPTDPYETVSICGARTQKGTPCKRRVRGTGRCWQHRGMPAIIRNTVVD